MKKAACYIRVSTEEQKRHGLSVDNQIDALTEYCQKNGYNPIFYNDAGISAHSSYKKRPALLRLIADCKAGKIEMIFFTRLDRWFRSVKDYYFVMDQIGSVPWKAIWEDYETETSSGQLKVNIMLAVAEAEAARTSEKIRSVIAWQKEQGIWRGGVPFGFKLVDKRITIDEEKKEIVLGAFSCYLRTLSTAETRKFLLANNVDFDVKTIRCMLKKEIYIDNFITQEQHDLIISRMKQHTRKAKQRTYIFSALMPCPYCGHIMSSGTTSTSKGYRCNNSRCNHFNLSERKAEKLCLNALEDVLAEASVNVEIKPKNTHFTARKNILDKMDRLKELYIDGEISRDIYDKRKKEYEEQLALIPEENKKELPKLPDGWRNTYDSLTLENRQSFWRSICSSIIFAKEKTLDRFIFL